jgi:sugar phosphate isomerase/epimerase
MKFAISNLSFGGFNYLTSQKLPSAMGLEIFYEFGDDHYWEAVIQQAYAERPVQGLSLHGPCVGVNLAEAGHSHYLSAYERFFKFAARWDADFVVVHTNECYGENSVRVRSRVKHRLERLCSLAAAYDVSLLVENVGLAAKHNLLFDWEEYYSLLAEFPQAGALLDTGHAHMNGWDLAKVVQRLGTRLRACHIHDNDGTADQHLCIGCGNIGWESFFLAIQGSVADMTLVFEYANVDLNMMLENIRHVCNRYLAVDSAVQRNLLGSGFEQQLAEA